MHIGLSFINISAKFGNSLRSSTFSTENILLCEMSKTVKLGNLSSIPIIDIIPLLYMLKSSSSGRSTK
jgi:hypothetical protein